MHASRPKNWQRVSHTSKQKRTSAEARGARHRSRKKRNKQLAACRAAYRSNRRISAAE